MTRSCRRPQIAAKRKTDAALVGGRARRPRPTLALLASPFRQHASVASSDSVRFDLVAPLRERRLRRASRRRFRFSSPLGALHFPTFLPFFLAPPSHYAIESSHTRPRIDFFLYPSSWWPQPTIAFAFFVDLGFSEYFVRTRRYTLSRASPRSSKSFD